MKSIQEPAENCVPFPISFQISKADFDAKDKNTKLAMERLKQPNFKRSRILLSSFFIYIFKVAFKCSNLLEK